MGKNLQIIMVIGHPAKILLYAMQPFKENYFYQNLINYITF